MISLLEYINNITETYTTIYDSDLLDEAMQGNNQIFPASGQSAKMRIDIGNHTVEREDQRDVSNKDIINVMYGAYNEIKSKYKTGEIFTDPQAGDGKNGEGCKIVITDCRKDRNNPVVVVCFISHMAGVDKSAAKSKTNRKWGKPTFIVKTVFKGDDFSGSKNSSNKNAKKIFLY